MKRIVLSLLLLYAISGFAQQIYYGYPHYELQSGDRIFVDIPVHQDGDFLSDGGIEDLISFLNDEHLHSFEIRVHYFYGSDGWKQSYSEFIAQCLRTDCHENANLITMSRQGVGIHSLFF